MIALAADPIDPPALLAAFTRAAGAAGAIVSFSGIVRPDGGVTDLWLDHHEQLTIAAIEGLAAVASDRFGLTAIAIVHRVGSVAPGEPIVFAAAAATHRRAAFDAVDYAMDRLKTDVPLWKCESRGADRTWVEARVQDHDDAARWEEAHD
jgi:molybdopterin synthase catalytic subunit